MLGKNFQIGLANRIMADNVCVIEGDESELQQAVCSLKNEKEEVKEEVVADGWLAAICERAPNAQEAGALVDRGGLEGAPCQQPLRLLCVCQAQDCHSPPSLRAAAAAATGAAAAS